MPEDTTRTRWRPTVLALVCLAVPGAVMVLGASARRGDVAFAAGVLAFMVAFACAASRRVPVWVPWLGPFAIFGALRIVSHHEHVAAHGGDDNGDLTDAGSIIVLLFTIVAISMAFWIRSQAPPPLPPEEP